MEALSRRAGPSDAQRHLHTEALRLAEPDVWRSSLEIGFTWATIVLGLGLYAAYPVLWLMPVVFIYVGVRQYALLILLHDASHRLLSRNRRINDLMSVWLLAAPCGSTFFNSRDLHLEHHKRLGQGAEDPDYFYYCTDEPSPKHSAGTLFWHFFKLLAGGQIFHTLFRDKDSDAAVAGAGQKSVDATFTDQIIGLVKSFLPVFVCQGMLLALFALAGYWWAYFVLWFLPLVTVATFLNGVRTFADHADPTIRGDAESGRRARLVSYRSSPLERFFLSPFHMNYHAEHHMFPHVPHYRLPELRRIIQGNADLRGQINWRGGYVSTIWAYIAAIGGNADRWDRV